jgi:hypothetical protein
MSTTANDEHRRNGKGKLQRRTGDAKDVRGMGGNARMAEGWLATRRRGLGPGLAGGRRKIAPTGLGATFAFRTPEARVPGS